MGSSALEVLVSCAQAIQDGNLRLADSLVDQIWNLAAAEFDEQQSKVVKYFGEALLRRAHGLRHTTDNYYLTLQMTPRLYYHYLWYGFNELVKDAINNTVRRKKRLHIIDFYIPHLYGKDEYLFEGLPNRPGDPLSVRVSVLLPPFLQKNVDFQEEMEYLTEEAKRFKVELEDLKVVYAHNLGEVDATMLDFRRTEDEAVIVCYMYKLHTLLAEGGVMERELMKLKQINPEIVIIEEQDANHNDSNFIKRRDIGNIIECEGKDRIVRHQTLAQWRSLLLTGGFLPVPIQPESRLYTTNSSKIHEENGCLVINEENRPVFFISAWKLMVEEDHFNPINNNFVQAERSPLNAPNPMSSNGVLEIQGPHEQENGKQTSFESNANNENEILKADVNNFLISTAKRRKLKSNVWEEFIKNPKDGDGKEWAICAHCNRKFDGASKKGTTHLRKHLERCKSRGAKVRDQQLIVSGRRGDSENQSVCEGNSSIFDQERSNMDVARMIIKHQFLLNIVEHEFFNHFLKNLQPMFKLQSQEALSSDMFCVYKEEKGRLLEYFDRLSCRFNLTISLWAHSLEKITYCCYDVQFIDDNWELKKKILALKNLGHEFDTRVFYESFKSMLVDWNFDKKVCSLAIHNSSSSFVIAEEIRKNWLSFEASHPLSTFVISSDECIHGLLGKDISGEKDYNMLQNVGKSINGDIGTSNGCLLDIHGIYYKKQSQQERSYPLMNVKSDNMNWRTSSLVLAIAAILDPRFKFDLVEFSYHTIYGYDAARIHLTMIRNILNDIFNEYAHNMHNGTSLFNDTINSMTLLNPEENTIDFFHRWYKSKRNFNIEASWKSELDKYLQQPIISSKMEFDVLGWWSETCFKLSYSWEDGS